MTEQSLTQDQYELVESNVGLAQSLSHMAFAKMNKNADFDEVLSAAYRGLVSAARNYDPVGHDRSEESIESGVAFSSYARRRILGSILDWQRAEDHVPRRQRRIYKDADAAGYGDGTPLSDVAQSLGIKEDKLRSIISRVESAPVSLDNFLSPEDDSDSARFDLSSNEDIESGTVSARVCQVFTDAWLSLDLRPRLVIALSIYGDIEIDSIASMLDIPITEAQKIHNESVVILHRAMLEEVK